MYLTRELVRITPAYQEVELTEELRAHLTEQLGDWEQAKSPDEFNLIWNKIQEFDTEDELIQTMEDLQIFDEKVTKYSTSEQTGIPNE